MFEPDSLLAAEVLAETVLEVTGDGHQSLTWPGHGFRLTVPTGAVPAGTTISLAVKSILSGEFELPDKCQLVSAIYWIKASKPFSHDVMLHLHHCAVIESEAQCSQYKFLAGRCSQPNLPYLLKIREGGVFTPRSHEASISVKQFSFYAIATDDPESSESFYVGQAFYCPVKGIYAWNFDFLITPDFPSLVDKVEDDYKKKGWIKHHDQYLQFEERDDEFVVGVTLHIAGPSSPDDKWTLQNITPPRIKKRRVDRMKKTSKPPHCQLAIKWNGDKRRQLPGVFRKVDLEGTKDAEEEYFSITLPETECSLQTLSESVTDTLDQGPAFMPPSIFPTPLAVAGPQLDVIKTKMCESVANQPAVLSYLADQLRCEGLITPAVQNAVKFVDGKSPYEKADAMITPAVEHVRSHPGKYLLAFVRALTNVGLGSLTSTFSLITAVSPVASRTTLPGAVEAPYTIPVGSLGPSPTATLPFTTPLHAVPCSSSPMALGLSMSSVIPAVKEMPSTATAPPHTLGAPLNRVDICKQLAESPDTYDRLADMLEEEELIATDTSLAVKADKTSAPYARASRMIRPAIEQAKEDQEKYQILIEILKSFKLRL